MSTPLILLLVLLVPRQIALPRGLTRFLAAPHSDQPAGATHQTVGGIAKEVRIENAEFRLELRNEAAQTNGSTCAYHGVVSREAGTRTNSSSDRESQYASHAFQSRLEQYGMTCSMSHKGNCSENATTSSLLKGLKNERV